MACQSIEELGRQHGPLNEQQNKGPNKVAVEKMKSDKWGDHFKMSYPYLLT